MNTDILKLKTELWQKGFQTLDGKKYYFNTGSGKMAVGWTTIDGNKYYLIRKPVVMATGDVTIDDRNTILIPMVY